MDTFGQKTMRGIASTFGTLAAALHLPAGMGCCGVAAMEAQIAAEGDESTSDDSSIFVDGEGILKDRDSSGTTPKVPQQKSATASKKKPSGKGERISKTPQGGSPKAAGGLKGFLSSARSLGWRKTGGGGEDDQSHTSQVSALSFLSGGLKMLASKGTHVLRVLREPNRLFEDRAADACSEISSLDESTGAGSYAGEPTRGALLWRRVRMVVHGVRGEGPSLAGTVRYRAARKIQGVARVKLAGKKAANWRVVAYAARQHGEDLRCQRRQREVDSKKRYKEACGEVVKRILEWSVKLFLQPRAAVDLQRVWRGYRTRKRVAAYVRWLEDRARRKREYERYLAALEARRGAGGNKYEQIKRRIWGRTEFTHTGWRPRYEVENPPNMHDHVWVPPRGSSSGVRTLKVFLPPGSERDRLTLINDKNSWAGVPVGITQRRPPPEKLGAPPRPGTGTDDRFLARSLDEGAGIEPGRIVTKYNWLPAPLVGKTALLQTPLNNQ